MTSVGILDIKSAKGIPWLEASTQHSRAVLGLLKELSETSTSVKEVSGRSVKVRTELSEGSDFSVLSKVELKRTGDGLHKLGLGGGTDSRHGHCQMLVWLAKKKIPGHSQPTLIAGRTPLKKSSASKKI